MADKTPATTIRLNDEDRQVISKLKKQLGMTSTTQVIRTALRLLAGQAVNVSVTRSDTKSSATDDTNE